MNSDDEDLRERFAALKREEQAGAPGFDWPSRHNGGYVRRKSAGMLLIAAVLLAAVFVAFPWLRPFYEKTQRRPPNSSASPGSLAEWKPPTSFLLDTPGNELLRSVPQIGVWQDGALAPRLTEKDRHAGRRFLP
jgi:hypothetical protein